MRGFRERWTRLRTGRALLPAAARPWALIFTVACAVVTVVIGVLVAHQQVPAGIDRAVDEPIISGLGLHQELLLRTAQLGSPVPVLVLSVVIVVSCLLAGRLNGAILGALAAPVADGLDELVLKPLFHRADLGFVSYPSGHTTAVFALGTTVTVLLAFPPAGSRLATARRALIPLAAFLLGCAVAVSLIGLRWHYFSDTVGGAAVAIGTVSGLALLLDLPATRRMLSRIAADRAGEKFAPDGRAAGLPGKRLAGPRAG